MGSRRSRRASERRQSFFAHCTTLFTTPPPRGPGSACSLRCSRSSTPAAPWRARWPPARSPSGPPSASRRLFRRNPPHRLRLGLLQRRHRHHRSPRFRPRLAARCFFCEFSDFSLRFACYPRTAHFAARETFPDSPRPLTPPIRPPAPRARMRLMRSSRGGFFRLTRSCPAGRPGTARLPRGCARRPRGCQSCTRARRARWASCAA